MSGRFHYITRPILILSLVSLFTDMASEMLYPIMPVFLESIGFSVALIGILEGFAEMIAGLSKGYFGKLSDVQQKRLPFVQWGYLLSALSKPMMALASWPLWIFFARTTDRVGKGLRSAPRDAMLSAQTTSAYKARVFGFHRSMDTIGAIIGPLMALVFLYFYPEQYALLFIVAFIPGIIAVVCTRFLKEEPGTPRNEKVHFFSFLTWLKQADKSYIKLISGLLLFALINSSDVLLLLKMKQSGVEDSAIILIYVFYNLVYALLAFPAGILADKLGIKRTLLTGLLLFALVYAGFALVEKEIYYWILFGLYGAYAACTEGIAKAWISNTVDKSETGTALGAYTGLSSLAAFPASAIAGAIWIGLGANTAFGISAVVACIAVTYLSTIPYRIHTSERHQG